MSLCGLLKRFSGMFRKRDRDLDAEFESHLQMQIDENIRRGMSAEQARRAALIHAGGIESAREAYRDQKGLPVLETTPRTGNG
jgi:hypothetical protein